MYIHAHRGTPPCWGVPFHPPLSVGYYIYREVLVLSPLITFLFPYPPRNPPTPYI